jgi:signal transduction histidine kinase
LRRLHTLIDRRAERLAAALHDDVGQVLACAQAALEAASLDAPPVVQARLTTVRPHLQQVTEQLRRLSHELHPAVVDDLGVVEAVKYTARAFARRTGVQLTIAAQLVAAPPRPVATVVYRVVQQALSNIAAHAHASSACLSITRDGRRLVCTIADDGVGFDVTALGAGHDHLGLLLCRARLEALGGTLDITSTPGHGTRIRAVVPFDI